MNLGGIKGDTNSYTIDVLRRWTTTLAQTSEAGASGWTLTDTSLVAIGDTVTVGGESRVVTGLPGEDFVAFDDATLGNHAKGTPAYGVGVVDFDSATVVFRVGDKIAKPITVTDPMGAAVVTLDPADTADVRSRPLTFYPWDIQATYPSGVISTLARGRIFFDAPADA